MKLFSRLLTCCAIAITFASCEKDSLNTEKLVLIGDKNPSGYSGEFLETPLQVKWQEHEGVDYYVHVRFIEGTGFVHSGYGSSGIYGFECKLGGESKQKIEISLYKGDISIDYADQSVVGGIFCDKIVVTINVSHRKGWACSAGLNSRGTYHDDQIVSFDDKTLYLIHYHNLYSSTDGGANWSEMNEVPFWNEISDLRFNSLGWAYALTEEHGIIYTKDGKEWVEINNGFLDFNLNSRTEGGLYVDDEILMASFNNGLYMSTDNGQFWKKLLVNSGTSSDGYRFMNRLTNGNIIVLDRWDDLWLSSNMGSNWTKVASSYSGYGMPVATMEVGYDGKIYIGDEYNAILAILDPTNSFSVERRNYYDLSAQLVSKIQTISNAVYYVVRAPAKGCLYSSKNWAKIDTGFSGDIHNYYIRKDGTFILISDNGVHYFRK